MDLETLLLFSAALAAWLWIDGLHARDIAMIAGRAAAEREGLQLLDETVAIVRLRARRDAGGRLRCQRTYAFEVSDTGADRLVCQLTLLGKRLESVEIPPHRDRSIRLF